MTKTELSTIIKNVTLPNKWIIQTILPKHKGNNKEVVHDTDNIILGQPIDEHMNNPAKDFIRKRNSILKQLNANRKGMKKWIEFGTGYGGGDYYDVHIGIDY